MDNSNILFGCGGGDLEIRRAKGATRLKGRFPYNTPAVLSDGGRRGRPKKEVIASRAFSYRVDRQEEDIHLLYGHSYDKPLASRGAGSLTLKDTDEALLFEATIADEMRDVSYVRDAMAAVAAGLVIGVSPGFRIPPERAVKEPVSVSSEPDNPEHGQHRAIIHTVNAALLYEVSLVTRPAYPETQVEMRNWSPPLYTDASIDGLAKFHAALIWR